MSNYARTLRKNMTHAEQFLWRRLRMKQLRGYKFRRQHPIGKYIADFVCLERRLIIEVDGGQHTKQIIYDSIRNEFFKEAGFRFIRFWNHEIFESTDAVLEKILYELASSPYLHPPPAKRGEEKGGGR